MFVPGRSARTARRGAEQGTPGAELVQRTLGAEGLRPLLEPGPGPQRDAEPVRAGGLRLGHVDPAVPRARVPNVPHVRQRNGLQNVPGLGTGAGEPFRAPGVGVPVQDTGHQVAGVLGRVHLELLLPGHTGADEDPRRRSGHVRGRQGRAVRYGAAQGHGENNRG